MLNKLTNLKIDSTSSNESIKNLKSLIVFEFSLKVPTYHVEKQSTSLQIIFETTPLNMPEGKYNVLDGIISHVEIKAIEQQIVAEIAFDFQTDFEIEIIEGIPAKFKLYISRKPLSEILKEKKILINPGFKEKTTSPTGLLHHIPMMAIAKKLHFLLTTCGAQSRLSWEKSPQEEDLEKLEEGILIDIFTETSLKKESRFKVYYSDRNEKSLKLAKYINESMSRKLQLDNLGIYPKSYNYKENVIPIGVVPAMENIRLDDAHLRDLDYRSKVAQAIFNGLVKFYAE